MATYSLSPSPSSFLRYHKQSSTSKTLVSETLILTNSVPKISTMSTMYALPNISYASFQRLRCCCNSSSSSIEYDESPSTRIVIKGLPQSTSEGSLKKEFSQFGEVNRVKILMDKQSRQSLGFAYLWFTGQESAKLAVKEMDGKFFEGRFIFVTTAKPGPSKSQAERNGLLEWSSLLPYTACNKLSGAHGEVRIWDKALHA